MQTQISGIPALQFQNTRFDVVDRNNRPWLRLPQIEGALGYANKGKGLSNLYQKHADEFTDSMTAVIKLPTAGGMQDARIFSLRGAHLLAMLSRTDVAKDFRRWVLDILERDGAVSPAPTFQVKPALSDAIAVYRESMTALLLAHTKKQAHLLACVSATRVTGFDLESMWAPAYPKATVGRVPQASLLPWHKPNPHAKQLERLARYLRNAKHLPVPKRAPAFTIEQCTRLLGQGYIPRQMLLKVMHVPASEFNLLIAEGKEAGIVRELDGIEFNYAGTLYVAGGAA